MLYILTLTWNACDKLSKLKESLMPSLNGIDYTWLIKDNASIDETFNVASTWGNNTKIIKYENNLQNFSQGMNYLFNVASPKDDDLVLLLNNDVTIKDNKSIRSMINIINKDTTVGAVGARLLYPNSEKLQHAGVVFNNSKNPLHFRCNETSDVLSEKNRLFQVVTGAVLLTKAEYFKNVCTKNSSGMKGMDEKYHWGFDDVDLCLSIGYNMEKKIVYCGNTKIEHEESASLKKNPANKLFLNHNLNYLKSNWFNKCVVDLNTYTSNPKFRLYEGK